MTSPFPGMDPFMELHWLDLHAKLTVYINDQLQDELPRDLVCCFDARVFDKVHDQADCGLRVELDLPERQPFLKIVDIETRNKVITVIELVSPTNKLPGRGRDAYLQTQALNLATEANLVEIDLSREGDRASILPSIRNLPDPQPAYIALVHRCDPLNGRVIEFHPLPLDCSLKPIDIPLRATDQDVVLRLQPLIEYAYQYGRYNRLDYSRQLIPPLSHSEHAFLAESFSEQS